MKQVLCVLLSICTLLVLFPTHVSAQEEQPMSVMLDQKVPASVHAESNEFIKLVSQELKAQDTSIVTELQRQIDKYASMMELSKGEKIKKLESLINTTYELIDQYESYSLSSRGTYHAVYSAEVAAAIAVFSSLGYDLSAELLTHAKDNDKLDSRYIPVYDNNVPSSPVFINIRDGSVDFGSGAFPNSGTSDQKDLYYAIHSFNYRKSTSGRVVIIEDRYDFEQGSLGSSFTGMIVDQMYAAQEAGVIVPYYVYIVQNTSLPAENQSSSVLVDTPAETKLYSSQVVLGKGEYKEFTIQFEVSGYKTFGTFGELNTQMYLYSSSGTLLTSDNNDGYNDNALLNYYCSANTSYKIRVYFYYASQAGEFLFCITPASSFIGNSSQSLSSYEDIWSISEYENITIDSNIFLNQTSVITFKAPSDGEYTFSISSDYDTYLYVIDPRASRMLVVNQDYNDDAGDGLNARVTKMLDANIPYLLVYCAYNPANASQVGDVSIHIAKN